ncbi:hypothetical protein EF917_23690 [Streptomyces sp. WAC00469]|uniref:Uncharacterized protein n=2 Tax=Streptomyces TaxID=1883 RepID=A0ABX0YWS0_STRTL|nr:hypothetical protein [Streptomyces thermoviolaceus]NJP17095.1 hypothetical protein [Streptomyces thermoviolaceus subsp. thermoviolaceus]RSR96466.1 hypothetical protein EF917_23690 [Streptomyces sp. WAC00469]
MTVSEPAEIGPLSRHLGRLPDLTVRRQRSAAAEGRLGVVETLQLFVPSAAVLTVAIRTLPTFVRSRRSSLSIELTRGDRSVKIDLNNHPDPERIAELAERLLGDD